MITIKQYGNESSPVHRYTVQASRDLKRGDELRHVGGSRLEDTVVTVVRVDRDDPRYPYLFADAGDDRTDTYWGIGGSLVLLNDEPEPEPVLATPPSETPIWIVIDEDDGRRIGIYSNRDRADQVARADDHRTIRPHTVCNLGPTS